MRRWVALVWMALIIVLPLVCWALPAPRWALGLVFGEFLGAVSYIWIGLSLKRALTQDPKRLRRNWWWHSSIRFALLGGALYLALVWPAVTIWAVLAGYTLVQLPAAVLRALVAPF